MVHCASVCLTCVCVTAGTKILAIEEPFRPWLNLSRSVGSREIFANFLHVWIIML